MSKIGWLPSLKTSAPGPPRAGAGMVSRTRGTGGTGLRCPKVLWAAGHRTLQIFLGWGWRWGLEMHLLGASESFSGNCGPAGGLSFFCFKSGNPPSVIMYSTYLHQDRIGPCHTRHASLQALPAWHGWFRLLGGRNDYHRPQVGGGIWVHKNAPKIMNFVKMSPFFMLAAGSAQLQRWGPFFWNQLRRSRVSAFQSQGLRISAKSLRYE